jgi:hypothetical protein
MTTLSLLALCWHKLSLRSAPHFKHIQRILPDHEIFQEVLIPKSFRRRCRTDFFRHPRRQPHCARKNIGLTRCDSPDRPQPLRTTQAIARQLVVQPQMPAPPGRRNSTKITSYSELYQELFGPDFQLSKILVFRLHDSQFTIQTSNLRPFYTLHFIRHAPSARSAGFAQNIKGSIKGSNHNFSD